MNSHCLCKTSELFVKVWLIFLLSPSFFLHYFGNSPSSHSNSLKCKNLNVWIWLKGKLLWGGSGKHLSTAITLMSLKKNNSSTSAFWNSGTKSAGKGASISSCIFKEEYIKKCNDVFTTYIVTIRKHMPLKKSTPYFKNKKRGFIMHP